MRKVLLGTSALIGAVSFMAGSAMAAQAPQVTVGGFLDFQAGVVDEDLDTGRSDYEFQNDTEIHISVDGKSDSGLGYGAVVELEADVTADADGEGFNADKTYLYLEGGWGRVEMGSNISAAQSMKVDASTLARATGGIDGDFYDFVAPGSTAGFIITPDHPFGHAITTEDATKLTYYSQNFSGFQLGLSLTPDSGDTGQAPFSGDTNVGDAENVIAAGLSYNGQFSGVGVAASVTGEFGDSESSAVEDLASWQAGLVLSHSGFSLGGSYGDWDESLMVSGMEADYWTLGAGYDAGAWGASLTYMDSSVETTGASWDFNNVSIGADYQLAPGMVPYIEVNFFELDAPGTASDNDGTVFLVGSELTF